MENDGQITRILRELKEGETGAESRLMDAVYPHLRRIAGKFLRGERFDHTLQASALVNEAYLEMVDQFERDWQNRGHFFALAANMMRRILVDYARERNALKREGGRQKVELTEVMAITEDQLDMMIALDIALDKLAVHDPRACKVVEMRYFAGLTEVEVAEILSVHPRTVKRDWQAARAFLHGQLNLH